MPAIATYAISIVVLLIATGAVVLMMLHPHLLLIPIAVMVVLVAVFAAHAFGSYWWMYGAGAPVLRVADGVVQGRSRPARRSSPAFDGWDFELPVHRIVNPRLTEAGSVAFDLPAEVSRALLADDATAALAGYWHRRFDTPAVWPASRMLRRSGRRERLDEIITALQSSPPGTRLDA